MKNKDLLITHTDLDGISPIILLNLTGKKFEYKTIEIQEVTDTFNELFESDLSIYDHIYVTDLTLTQEIYDYINKNNINIKVFDHHEVHSFANIYDYTTITNEINGKMTCGTELFYLYLKEQYECLNKQNIKEYVEYVRQSDTFTFIGDEGRDLELIRESLGKIKFIKTITNRLAKDKEHFEFSSFEKRFTRIKKEELKRFMEKKEEKILRLKIDGKLCGVIFSEYNKSELGNYLSNKYPELDLIILIDASSRISYRTTRDDILVNEFASTYGGGGHRKASGSKFDDEDRIKIIENYFKNIERLEEN